MGHVTRMGEREGAYRVLVGEHQRRRPLRRPRRKWKDTIKTDFKEKKKDSGVNWINVAEDWDKCQAVVNTVKIHRFT